MKSRKSVAVVAVAALGLAGAVAFANAQTSAAPAPQATNDASQKAPESGCPGMGMGQGMMGGGMGWDRHGQRLSKEDRAAFFDARVAAIHVGLRLTAEQEKLWPPVESAVRDMGKALTEMHDKMDASGRSSDPIEGMRRMAQFATARGAALVKVADAAAPLYAALTAEQKERLPHLMHMGMGGRMGMGGPMGMGMRRDGGPGRRGD